MASVENWGNCLPFNFCIVQRVRLCDVHDKDDNDYDEHLILPIDPECKSTQRVHSAKRTYARVPFRSTRKENCARHVWYDDDLRLIVDVLAACESECELI